LCGSPNKIKTQLGWEPQIDFKELVKIMVEGDIKTNGDR
jgi:GDPmannose 4,6-dehydratase